MCFLLVIRRPPRSTLDRSSAASDVYKRQPFDKSIVGLIELKRVILNNDTQIVACTIKLIPVSNMEGTLTKFKLWSVQFDYLKCRLDVWHRYFDVDMLITLKTVIRDSTGVYRQALLLQDMISLAAVSYTHLTLPTSDLV